jgi:hypothetical protein
MLTQELQTEPSSSCSGVEFYTLQSQEIEREWSWIKGFLERVDSYEWDSGSVKKDLLSTRAQLWVIGRPPMGIAVTRIENYYANRYGVIWIASGTGIDLGMPLLTAIESWFTAMGCKFSQVVGRKGWDRMLPEYEERGRIYVKDLV